MKPQPQTEEANTMNTADIKFVSNQDGGWQGNGFGTLPNSYTVVVDGDEIGQINKSQGRLLDCWRFYRRQTTYIDGVEFDYEIHPSETANTLSELKSKVRALIAV